LLGRLPDEMKLRKCTGKNLLSCRAASGMRPREGEERGKFGEILLKVANGEDR
jgi:hypothetical protein